MIYKILIQPAKSSKSICKNCNTQIDANTLRAKVVDARDFKAYIKKHGHANCMGEGMSRGYFEDVNQRGQPISIKKYFVHLDCYKPIEPHPFEKQFFDVKTLRKQHIQTFDKWLQGMNRRDSKPNKKRSQKKTVQKNKKRETVTKTKSITKSTKNKPNKRKTKK